MKRTRLIAAVVAACGALMLAPLGAQQDRPGNGPDADQGVGRFHRKGPNKVANQYIVVLDRDATGRDFGTAAAEADEILSRTRSGRVKDVYTHAISGFSAVMSEEDAIALSADPRVAFVEEDGIMEASLTQTNATWGLDRIDQRNLSLSTTYSYMTTGSGVHAYVIDTGILVSHSQFGGRASVSFDSIGDGRNGIDCHGHGTHVAGTIGGSTWGVAKSVTLHAVRVLNCSGSGTNSGVIAGVDWVTANRQNPAVANMSLGGGISTALDNAVRNSIASGVVYAIAAGNSNQNASNFSPARVGEAITVGASTSTDRRASFSNFGSVVDIFAPGQSITSAWITSSSAVLSGTSMAAPHVAGVAARIRQSSPGLTPAQVRDAIVADATTGRLTSLPGNTANRLLFRAGTQ